MTFIHSSTHEPGTYSRAKISEGVYTALIVCPGCKQVGSLSDHTIDEQGNVSPSVVCPYECGFHEYIQLEGWNG